jgi:CheY-like chemotaxis protein
MVAAVPPRRVLVVEDEHDVLHFLCTVLRDAGYMVESAGDGAEALAKIDNLHPDLIVLDLMMPRLDGWGVLEQMRRDRDPRAPAVVILSAFPDPWRAIKAGAWECLEKPFQVEQLLKTCARALVVADGLNTK